MRDARVYLFGCARLRRPGVAHFDALIALSVCGIINLLSINKLILLVIWNSTLIGFRKSDMAEKRETAQNMHIIYVSECVCA